MSTKKLKRVRAYYERNKHFQCWLPESLYNWLMDYMQKYSYGDSDAERFRIMLFELEKLEQQQITFVNPRQDKEKKRRAEILEQFGNVKESDLICLKHIDRSRLTTQQKGIHCGYCRETNKELFKACQEIREEYNQLNKKEGI